MLGNSLTIHAVNPTGMFSYGKCETVNLINRGLVNLVGINEDKGGDSNGSGKSSLFNAICEVLFGENPTGEKGDSIINSVWGKGMAGRVMFTSQDGQHYRVTYVRNWKDSQLYPVDNDNKVSYVGSNLFIDKFESGVWRDVRAKGMPDTRKKILEIIGMTYRQFLSIAYMSHRVGDQFLRGTNKDRMDVLSAISGIEEWDRYLEEFRSKKKVLGVKIDSLEKRQAYEQGSIQTLQDQLQGAKAFDWAGHIQTLEANLEAYRAAWSEANNRLQALNTQIAQLTVLRDQAYNREKVDLINKEIATLGNQSKILEQTIGRPLFVQDDPALKAASQKLSNELNSAKGSLSSFLGSSSSILELEFCPTCEGKISKTKKDKIQARVTALQTTIQGLEQSHVASVQDLVTDRATRLDKENSDRAKLAVELNTLRSGINAKLSEIKQEQDKCVSYDQDLASLRSGLGPIQMELNTFQSSGQQVKSQIANAVASVEGIKVLEAQILEKLRQSTFFENEAKGVRDELSIWVWLIENTPFIKLHKMSATMAEISDSANRFFAEIGETTRINIKSFDVKAKKSHAADLKDLLKSEVNVEIVDGPKNIAPRLYSDGESSKISLAIIKSLGEKARLTGQGCNLMLLDEIFSFVDPNNSQKIASSMASFLGRGTVFLTDNSGSAKNLMTFDQTWTVRKKDGQTTLEIEN